MTLRGWLVFLFGPGVIMWAIMSAQVVLCALTGWLPWGEPMAAAAYLTGVWWAAIGATTLVMAIEDAIQRRLTK